MQLRRFAHAQLLGSLVASCCAGHERAPHDRGLPPGQRARPASSDRAHL